MQATIMRRKYLRNLIHVLILTVTCVVIIFVIEKFNSNRAINKQELNLIIISVDTLRADHMSSYAYSRKTTPNIDEFAKKSILYTNAYTTFPETMQSFYSLFTGTNDPVKKEHLIHDTNLNLESNLGENIWLPNLLKKNGFNTAAFVTNPVIGSIFPLFKKGFNSFEYSNYLVSKNIFNTEIFKYDYNNSLNVTKNALDWLDMNSKSKFFLWAHYTTPHMPYNPSSKYICAIDTSCKLQKYSLLLSEGTPYSELLKSCSNDVISQNRINLAVNLYDSEILSVDEQVGELLNGIRRAGLLNNTIIIFYSDHGEGFDHNMFGHKNSLYESSIKIPLIIYHPQLTKGRVDATLVDNTDILPSILELLNIEYNKERVEGISFLSNRSIDSSLNHTTRKKIIFSTPSSDSNKQAIYDGRYKYILSNSNDCIFLNYKEELYDVINDPYEMHNIILQKENIAEKLKSELMSQLGERKEIKSENQEELIENLKSIGY